MIAVTPFQRLGSFRNDWLDTHYHFSFASYYDPERMGFGPLRVWNDDRVAPGTGFDMHGHRDMEIITYVRKGAITHTDHLHNTGRTEAGDVQVMSAGTGILHAERNQDTDPVNLFQIWIEPARRAVKPRWEQRRFPQTPDGILVPLASGRIDDPSVLKIYQDATLYGASAGAGGTLELDIEPGRIAYLVPSVGDVTVNGVAAPNRSGVMIADERHLSIGGTGPFEIVLADLPGTH